MGGGIASGGDGAAVIYGAVEHRRRCEPGVVLQVAGGGDAATSRPLCYHRRAALLQRDSGSTESNGLLPAMVAGANDEGPRCCKRRLPELPTEGCDRRAAVLQVAAAGAANGRRRCCHRRSPEPATEDIGAAIDGRRRTSSSVLRLALAGAANRGHHCCDRQMSVLSAMVAGARGEDPRCCKRR
jgi:hypothetical protein